MGSEFSWETNNRKLQSVYDECSDHGAFANNNL